ncbi:TetR/AcrR family transcriptional regulator [Cnuibacter sp. UC19_7]|uniref:TetR/AcrR family transcriptional regulator n=1 Tax=Cnuibacter sp. UC19_7 TaxID=3350166 RepID=UPI0036712F1F
MTDAPPLSSRDRTRAELVKVAAGLLAEGGPSAVTTRSVAQAAGMQAPAIYRLFGDKVGLLAAVVEDGYASYVGAKHVDEAADPVADLRLGWDVHIDFGLDNPELFRLMHSGLSALAPEGSGASGSLQRGTAVLHTRVRRVAEAGRLAVAEPLAVDLVRASATGVVFTLLDGGIAPQHALRESAWLALAAVILTSPSSPSGRSGLTGQDSSAAPPAAVAAVTLGAALPTLDGFTPGERALLSELLARVN